MIEVTGAEEAVSRLFHPESVAVVGASSRSGALSWWPVHLLQQYEFAGRIYPVNPNRSEIDGIACYPSVAAIDGPVDVAVIAMDATHTLEAARECAAVGVGTVVLPAQGFGELNETGRAAEATLLEVARASGMRIVGPNTDGVANLGTGAVMSIQPLFGDQMPLGDVAVVTQSGASAGSLISRLKREGIGCRLYASAGNEIDLGLADYLSTAVQDPDVRLVLSFVEAIRKPEEFAAVGRLAAELGKPIVLIKVGRTQQAAERAAAHTGALAGVDRIYEAVFRSLGVIRVDELSEIVAVAKYYLAHGVPTSPGIGLMSVSGGQAGALADVAIGTGLTVPRVAPETEQRLGELLPFGSALNPCDLTGQIAIQETLAADVYQAMADDPSVDTVVYARKELTGHAGRKAADHLADAAAEGTTPLVVYAMDGGVNEDEEEMYRRAGVPIFLSARELFGAVQALADYGTRTLQPREDGNRQRSALLATAKPGVLGQQLTTQLLRSYGIDALQDGVVTDADQARQLAGAIGYPVVMKIVSERIPHKTEIGGVVVGVRDEAEAKRAYDVLMERGRSAIQDEPDGVLIQQQVTDGVEMIVGLVVDAQFGPFVLLGTGGVLAEVFDDVALRPAPVRRDQALEMLGDLKGSVLLEGFRGAPSADVEALADVVVAVSQLGAAHADLITEMDLNPVLVRPKGLGAVVPDALVVLARAPGR